jgi:hypothetical protein
MRHKNENPQAVRQVCQALIAVMDELGSTVIDREFLETVVIACNQALAKQVA